ncbi:uncharacterized protein OCT59_009233 [Rhizophagus irregularis]|uniref:Uncharacterized protein n=3 Tax=Rhizophagus irregularis TaxID=588596 RepID=U9TSE9_RHIID|nr:hypothetical protein GLOIN_2v1783077 [Rhizophagus irregularis DAOM 181602=DAOM 197198]EXX57631.1 hypothetical protein RirG_205350 [Rhizophagus irregularis DAOM 197198w]PKK67852.1 hypothetical protein RhiirC2_867590 [Rhizophagus irregularis]POG64295.1 hypothetical protein GLOIN_2v1783077 [Rhizophagus irregularis DAOM 181602=DAOM 197198]UZO17901.1 hypothetical protein OCT59_009233 [Rhizophagus irregularis]CAB4397668.1 unnamed protein product [Rhizophagus irregularis]|eukprot:XP_025171161.1 hypothetical protein GLOIN_2v1783077 [Rhizophagus irregularis DAOM 181602=DAOM 197198]
MSFPGDNNHESNSEYFDDSLQSYYENVPTNDYNVDEQPSVAQYYQKSSQHERIQPNDIPTSTITPASPYNASAEILIPKISRRIDSSQNQILKIELEIVIKLQNDQNQQKAQYVHSSALPKNRANRMNPYRKPTEQNFRNKNSGSTHSYSSSSVPQLNRSSAIYMQNIDNNRAPQSQFQPNEDLNESFSNNYNNTFYD